MTALRAVVITVAMRSAFVKEVVDLSGTIPFLEPHCGERSRCDGVCADHD